MAMRQKIRLTVEDGDPIEVVADGRDVRTYEAWSRKSALREPMSVTMLTYMGYAAAKRQGMLDEKWDVFNARCIDVTGLGSDDEDEPDPTTRTRKSRGGGSS